MRCHTQRAGNCTYGSAGIDDEAVTTPIDACSSAIVSAVPPSIRAHAPIFEYSIRYTPPRSHGAFTQVLDPRIRLHFEYFQSILENLSRSDRLADTQNRRDRRSDACRKVATRGVPRKSLDLSVEFPIARRLWRVAPSDGTGLAMMAHGSVGTGRAGAALGTPFSDMVGRLRRRVSLAS
jgi:hypothetical protein